MKARTFILLIVAALTSISTTPTPLAANSLEPLLQTPTTIPMLPGSVQQIKVAPGHQTNPHVACSLASYTDDDLEGTSLIKYFDFATNTEQIVPGNGLDRLSNTDGQRIAFTQLDAAGDHIVVYDIASQTTISVPGNNNWYPVLGGNLVAFVHGSSFGSDDEIVVYDRNTGNVTQLTNDTLIDRHPAVSPDGSVIVWEKCQANQTGCDIYSATQTGPGAFTTRQLTGAGEDQFPDTNGQIVAYTSDKSGENDIYFQRLGSSTEMHLSIPGDQRDLSLSGNLIAFESGTPGSYDIFLYDLSTARLYRVTNTPEVDETLTDVIAGCNGINRIVYAIPGGFGDFDIWGFNFQLSDSTADQLNDLIALVRSFNLPAGTENSLVTKLQDALTALDLSDTASFCDSLTAFANASQAQVDKKLTADQVMQLVNLDNGIKSDRDCQ
ncbi:MAG TPA: hypothetical protein VJ875_18815 [Pyrinomonadaceae bacterium]|nr:hypothetical protein [Pyrinomonadaceae bacterium]